MRVDWCVSSWFRIKNTHSHTAIQHPATFVAVALEPALVRSLARARLGVQDVLEALPAVFTSRTMAAVPSSSPCNTASLGTHM